MSTNGRVKLLASEPRAHLYLSSSSESKVSFALVEMLRAKGFVVHLDDGDQMIEYQAHSQVQRSDVVVVDITGNNPYVSFELGVARGLGKPVVLISDKNYSPPKFYSSLFTLYYDAQEVAKLSDDLTFLVDKLLPVAA
ncbi:hypothetical protein IT575_03215 [bacterium]|nr:hypothetical protein [bacterium]